MTVKNLFKILLLVESVDSHMWRDVMQLVDAIANNKAEVIEKQWAETYKQNSPDYYPLDLSKLKTWSTIEGECINLKYFIQDGELICKAKIWDGGSFDGLQTRVRFTATISLPRLFIHNIESKITYAFDKLAEGEHENYLEAQKNAWMSNFKSEILK
jgi:hypothetical protein